MEEEARRELPKPTTFVWTEVAKTIKAAASYALDQKTIAMVYGPDSSGVGNTTSLQAIYELLGPRRCSFATINKVDANPTGLLRKLLAAMHIDDKGSNKQRFDRLVEKLTGRSHLFLIDQIHNLRWAKDDKPFYILTDLHDATGCAQLWTGTADLVSYLHRREKSNADESLAQIRRRIFPIVDVLESLRGGGGEPLVTVDDVIKIFARNKLRITSEAARFLCRIANEPDSGSVGLCVRLVEYATAMGVLARASVIDVPLLREALRRGFSFTRADQLLHRIEADQPAAVARAV